MVDYFFVVKMLLDDKSHTTEKPAYFPLNVDTFGRKMHLWLEQKRWVCSMCPWILAKSGLRWQALNRKLMSGFQACLPGSVNRTINGPHSQILPAHTSLFCSYHSESSWIRIDLNSVWGESQKNPLSKVVQLEWWQFTKKRLGLK